jgi:hypothetical protein
MVREEREQFDWSGLLGAGAPLAQKETQVAAADHLVTVKIGDAALRRTQPPLTQQQAKIRATDNPVLIQVPNARC